MLFTRKFYLRTILSKNARKKSVLNIFLVVQDTVVRKVFLNSKILEKKTQKFIKAMKNIKIFFFVKVFSIFLLSYCVSKETKENPKSYSLYWNHFAEFIAGVDLSPENPFRNLASRKVYLNYKKNLDDHWTRIQKNYLTKMNEWQKEHLTNLTPENTTLYPLAGGDFVNMYSLNSDSPKFIMIGLQKPGFIRDPLNFSDAELKKALASVENVVYELAYYNYSTSRRLQQEVGNPYLTGIAPTLLFFIKRFGYDVLNLDRVYLDEEGKVNIDESPFEIFDKKKYTGVRILFTNQEQGKIKELYFFRIWLSANSASQSTPEGKFLLSQGRLNLMFKSAEYIFHTKEYEPFILDLLPRTDRVVQDESGIPFHYFNSNDWSYKLFGKYIGKIQLKNTPKVPFQNDLNEAFQKESKPLPFPFGYGVLKGKDKSNLLIFERKSLPIKAVFLK